MKRFYPTAILRVIGHAGSRALHPVTAPVQKGVMTRCIIELR